MQRFRRGSAVARPWIAVAVSYAVALQMMLLGVATVRLAAADAPFAHGDFVICSPAGDRPGKPRAHDAACAPCAMSGGSPAVLLAAWEQHFPVKGRFVCAAPVAAATVVSPRHTPRQSQGPPPSA
jgi:hypothetical protein